MDKKTDVSSLQAAIDQYPSVSAFARALTEQVQAHAPDTGVITRSHVANWIARDTGVPARHAPDVEAITGVKVELLRPEVAWYVVRGSAPTQRRRATPSVEAAGQLAPAQQADASAAMSAPTSSS